MSSFESEEEKLFQMVHDFMESSESPSSSSSSSPLASSSSNINISTSLALQEILTSVTESESEVLECVLKHTEKSSGNLMKKWLVLKLKMDGFNASLCQTSCVTSLGFPAGDYEYIEIMLPENKENTNTNNRLIVDTDFKSQFELARPTQTYKELTEKIPSIFVGNEEKLNKIISLLCSAAKQSLKERGLHIPPWRTRSYMHSKWLSSARSTHHKMAKNSIGFISREKLQETRGVSHGVMSKKRRDFRGGSSGLSSQFSDMGINCC
ncbi:hypothetical protein Patl1_27859 [Pistacia atlantica]|uniref:Uncharacterized protein n=1 Tax=Pistacia atlantica TaxID=434234 RepID=A0ACC1BF66_9ROSI|nr:hypothetical protein Patl1_27859 [Pistacia atlantica]